METKSDSFNQFIDSIAIRDQRSAEDYDLEALLQIEGAELEEATNRIVQQLLEGNDPRAARALGYLKGEKVISALQQAITTKTGSTLVEVALSYFKLTEDESAISAILHTLAHSDKEGRIAAAETLRHFKHPQINEALYQALQDEVPLVRANALEALYQANGLVEWDRVPGRGIGLLRVRLSSDFPDIRNAAINRLEEIIEAKAKGATAEDLQLTIEDPGRSPACIQFIQSFASSAKSPPWNHDYDLQALDALKDEEFEWAKFTLFFLLQNGDFRAARALTHIKATPTIAVFRNLLPKSEGRLGLEVARGLYLLEKNAEALKKLESFLQSEDQELQEMAKQFFETNS